MLVGRIANIQARRQRVSLRVQIGVGDRLSESFIRNYTLAGERPPWDGVGWCIQVSMDTRLRW